MYIILIRILLLNSICISYLCHSFYQRRPLEDLLPLPDALPDPLPEVEELLPELFEDLDPLPDPLPDDLLPLDDELRLMLSASLMSSSSSVSIGACVRVPLVGSNVGPTPLAGSCSSVGEAVVGFFDGRSVGLSKRGIVSA